MSEMGKSAKHMGKPHPKIAPMPPDRPTPAARPSRKADKPYGYTFEYGGYRGRWRRIRRWFEKAVWRDQAYAKEEAHQKTVGYKIFGYRDLRKLER